MPIRPQRSRSFPALLPLLSALLIPLLIAILACDSLSGKPSTAAPSISADSPDFWPECRERERAIDAWLERRERKLGEDFIEGEDFLRLAVRAERDQEEAKAMKKELRDNCRAKSEQGDSY